MALELNLDWDTVKTLEKQYRQAQLAKAGTPGPKAIGLDEISTCAERSRSIRKGHTYRIVVSFSDSRVGRSGSAERTARRRAWRCSTTCPERSRRAGWARRRPKGIRLAVMDMWKPFRTATNACASQAVILFDKFHVVRHLNDALDRIRKPVLSLS